MTPSEELSFILNEKSKIIGKTYVGPSYHVIQNIIRCIDNLLPFPPSLNELSAGQIEHIQELISFGWPRLLKPYYDDINIETHLPFQVMTDDLIQWTISNLIFSGKIELCRQLISYEKAGLLIIDKHAENSFTFSYSNEFTGIEQYDRESAEFYKIEIVNKIVDERRKAKPFDEKKIKSEFEKLILNPLGQLISYDTTPEIDDYYNEEGHYRLLMMQGYDDFDNKDIFGGIEYSKYIDVVELIIGVGIKHSEACFMVKQRNNKVNLENLLTYTQTKARAINDYANYLGWDTAVVQQIFETITLTKENYDYYLEYPATPPPIFVEVGGQLLMRSIAGCFANPFSILNRELKRKYKKDYDKALNNRENRFRKELFLFFPQEQIVKIQREIKISFEGIKTDIDAIVFDKQTGTLGLFQLKWQDPYAHSMKERFSRITNLFPKANEWISKIRQWIAANTEQTILNSLQIDKELVKPVKINEICVFILSRNQINFTGVELDNTVAWSSWYQLIESNAKIKTMFDDPIREMYVKIKAFRPEFRSSMEGKKEKPGELEIDLGDVKLSHKK
ncbi:hypothetical protein [Solitalea canadensis]|uniref:Uncharacterized protein n=1 Tax=Solitalea canadensis (strain ATCC 29591 / DSM 3403 / JCM 21819 / LMG 8368 / NBRC 15130 / NCIMB 12057 / USAM 9D) TaxID=929556 RepID=H8KVX6_SOLCM|nr:hypothetical protein [Solitalea canadensis]AFD06879.1 hypothetical protein Solca_1817 [Solitalea canadensis DSM 3403]